MCINLARKRQKVNKSNNNNSKNKKKKQKNRWDKIIKDQIRNRKSDNRLATK